MSFAGTPAAAAIFSRAARSAARTETIARDADFPEKSFKFVDRCANRVSVVRAWNIDVAANSTSIEGTLGDGDGHTAVRTVVRRSKNAGRGGTNEQIDEATLAIEVQFRRTPSDQLVQYFQILASAKLARTVSREERCPPLLARNARATTFDASIENADNSENRCRINRFLRWSRYTG